MTFIFKVINGNTRTIKKFIKKMAKEGWQAKTLSVTHSNALTATVDIKFKKTDAATKQDELMNAAQEEVQT